jgi:membrane protein DedA with SNARE-associated domain
MTVPQWLDAWGVAIIGLATGYYLGRWHQRRIARAAWRVKRHG